MHMPRDGYEAAWRMYLMFARLTMNDKGCHERIAGAIDSDVIDKSQHDLER
jgi:hypothetical protein